MAQCIMPGRLLLLRKLVASTYILVLVRCFCVAPAWLTHLLLQEGTPSHASEFIFEFLHALLEALDQFRALDGDLGVARWVAFARETTHLLRL